MSNWRLQADSISDPYKIYFSLVNHPVSTEIVKELKKIFFNFVSVSSLNSADIIIYFVLTPAHFKAIPNSSAKTLLIVKSSLVRHLPSDSRAVETIVPLESYSSPVHIARAVLSKLIHGYTTIPTPTPPSPSRTKTKSTLLAVLVLFITPWLVLASQLPVAYFSTSCQRSSVRNLNISRLASCARVSSVLSRTLPVSVRFSVGASSLASRIGYPPILVTQFLVDLSQSSLNFSQLSLLVGSQSPSASGIANLKFLLSQQSEFLASLLADTRSLYQASPRHPQIFIDLAKDINDTRDLVIKSQTLLDDLPRLLSLDSLTTYLILIQDSTELRPSGGFIDHAILATVDHGRLTSIQFLPSASLDRNPPERLVPPPDFTRLLNQTSWYFRDSNWDPDFPTSSRFAIQLSQKAVLSQPDVIVAVNSQIFDDFANPYLSALSKDGASSTFMLDYSQTLFNKVKSLTPDQISRLIMTTLSLLDSRQIFIYPSSFALPSLSQLGWDGSLHLPPCRSTSPCLTDFFYPTFTNIGLNKTDAYIQFQSSLNLTFTASRLASDYTLELKNSSPTSSWPQGANKNYLRIFLPSRSVVDQIQVNHKKIKDFTLTPQKNLTQLGLVVDTPAGSSSQLNIQYHQNLSESNFHYQLDSLRQPGVPATPLSLVVNYPSAWFVTAQSPPSIARPGYLQYNTSITGISRLDLDISTP